MKGIKHSLSIACLIGFFFFYPLAHVGGTGEVAEGNTERCYFLEEWLMAGPSSMPLPALIGKEGHYAVKDLLEQKVIDPTELRPEEGKSIAWDQNTSIKWKAAQAESGHQKIPSQSEGAEMALLFCYVEASRWIKASLEITSSHLFKVFLDGFEVTSKTSVSSPNPEKPISAKKEITLSCGKHRLLIMALKDPECGSPWDVKSELKTCLSGDIKCGISPERYMTEDDVHNAANITRVAVAPDGSATACTMVQRNPRIKKAESWIDIRSLPDGELEQSFRDSQGYRNLRWSPDSEWISAIVPGGKGTSGLWLVERRTNKTRILLENVKGLSSATWSPAGTSILYSITEKPDEMIPDVYKLEELDDRWITSRSLTHLYTVMVDSGVCRRLTAGGQSATGQFASAASPFSPEGSKILFLTSKPDYHRRPYVVAELYVQDLNTNHSELVFSSPYAVEAAQWTSDGQNILFLSGQSADREKKSADHIPNDYEKDLFILDPDTGAVKNLTSGFAPALVSIKQLEDGSILMLVMDKMQQAIYVTDTGGSRFSKLNLGIDFVHNFDADPRAKFLAYTGTSLQNPIKLYSYDFKAQKNELLYDPGKERFDDIVFPEIEDFKFKNKQGVDIEGWLRYPAGFDPQKKHPLIVHYYGGTHHTPKSFDIRVGTSHHYLTTNGYAVYVLNPSGAPGWGPEFSDLHVNDWGKTVSQEIIAGVREILKAKPFLDPKRVGAYGGSYGGFMTMTLATKTDLFRTLIALYGISNITSYWGAGWWGFWYSGVAAAESFPWNRNDIYVGRSPVFHADDIETPLLLLHGDADINVPVEESEQMFTALKLLNKDVEYIRFKGEDHGIMGTDANRILLPKIMLAWWDKDLKDQPEAWEELWKKAK